MYLPNDPALLLLGLHPRVMERYVPRKICLWMFIDALFIAAPKWKLSTFSLTNEWVNKCAISIWWGATQQWKGIKYLYICGKNLKTLMLSERARHVRLYIVWFHLYEMLEKDKTVEIENKSLAAEDWRWEWELSASRPKGCLEVVVFQNWVAEIFSWLYAFKNS